MTRMLTVIGALCIASTTLAQTPPPTPTGTDTLNTVVVTGSRIIHTDTDTPSPLQVISSVDLQESGYNRGLSALHISQHRADADVH